MTEYPYELYQTSAEFEKHVSLDGDAKEALEAALEAAYHLGLAARTRIAELEKLIYSAVENGVYEDGNIWWDKLTEIWREVKARAALKGQEQP